MRVRDVLIALLFVGARAFELPPPPMDHQVDKQARSLFAQRFKMKTATAADLYRDIENHRIMRIILDADGRDGVIEEESHQLRRIQIHPSFVSRFVDMSLQNHVDLVFLPDTIHWGWVIARSVLIAPLFAIGWMLFSAARRVATRIRVNPTATTLTSSSVENRLFNTTFADWAGSPEVLMECREIVSFLRDRKAYEALGAKIPRGILMEGPPGTGKTLLAKAMANEAHASFIMMSGSEFVELFVGMGASRVRQVFDEARKHNPCILFLDEIDAIGKRRASSVASNGGGGNDEREQTLNQLLTEMDGFLENTGLIVLAATNRRDVLDPALLRPGRFDRILHIPLPDRASRRQILATHARNKPLNVSESVWGKLAYQTEGYSGAELCNLLNEAALLSARENATMITENALWRASEKLLMGIRKEEDGRDANTRRRVALHEAGHTVICLCFPEYFQLQKVSIQETYQGAGGYTIYHVDPEMMNLGTRDFLKKQLSVLLGGRAAEQLFYGEDHVSTGASEDLRQAHLLSHKMIRQFGMGSSFFPSYEISPLSDQVLALSDHESMMLIQEAYRETLALVTRHQALLSIITDHLLNDRELSEDQVHGLWQLSL